MAIAEEHDLQPLDLFGFFFDGVLDANALVTLKANTKLLQKLYKATPNKKKTQKFLLVQVRACAFCSTHLRECGSRLAL